MNYDRNKRNSATDIFSGTGIDKTKGNSCKRPLKMSIIIQAAVSDCLFEQKCSCVLFSVA